MFLSQILKLVPMCGLIWCRSGVSTYNVEIANKLQTGEWFQVPDLALRDHYLVVPLDYENPKVSSITIFVREVVAGMQPRSSCRFPDINSMCDESGTFIWDGSRVQVTGCGSTGLLRDGRNVIVWSMRYWSLYQITCCAAITCCDIHIWTCVTCTCTCDASLYEEGHKVTYIMLTTTCMLVCPALSSKTGPRPSPEWQYAWVYSRILWLELHLQTWLWYY